MGIFCQADPFLIIDGFVQFSTEILIVFIKERFFATVLPALSFISDEWEGVDFLDVLGLRPVFLHNL